ncbi:MAG TPA: hypothetical protein VGP93_07430, partial [Polyangiaceae bacterium]|nr:hypothetical protein [Polyangiaceae bacterium]
SSFLGRGLVPALPGSTTGIGRFIGVTYSLSSVLSQLVAAGAVAFVLRLSGLLLVERRLGIAFRTVALPAATAVAALTVAAAHDGLEPSMHGVLAVACLMSAAVSVPFGLQRRETRAVGLVLLFSMLASSLHFAALELALRAGEAASAVGYTLAQGVATFGWLLKLGTLIFTLLWLGGARAPRIAALSVSCLLVGFALTLVAREGLEPDASAWTVVVSRTFDQLARPPLPMVPWLLRRVVAGAIGITALLCLLERQRGIQGALFTLCLIGLGAVDVPLAALLLCAGSLSLPLLALRREAAPAAPSPSKTPAAPPAAPRATATDG